MNESSEQLSTPFMNAEQTLICMLRTCFASGDMSAQLLSDALEVDLDLCIKFSAAAFSSFVLAHDEDDEDEVSE